jgi:hypothetical protein
MLDIGPDMLDSRLDLQLVADTAKVFHEEIVSRIAQRETPAARASWSLLSGLLNIDQSFAENLMLANWPVSGKLALSVVDAQHGKWTAALIKKIKEAQVAAGPAAARGFMEDFDWYGPDHGDGYTNDVRQFSVFPKGMLKNIPYSRTQVLVRDSNNRQVCRLGFVASSQSKSFVVGSNLKAAPGWGEYQALVPFLTAPSSSSLAETLRQLAKCGREAIPSHGFPWVLVSLLREEEEGAPFEVLAHEVERGQFGDIDVWNRAEQRWEADGIRVADFEQWSSGAILMRTSTCRGFAIQHR